MKSEIITFIMQHLSYEKKLNLLQTESWRDWLVVCWVKELEIMQEHAWLNTHTGFVLENVKGALPKVNLSNLN